MTNKETTLTTNDKKIIDWLCRNGGMVETRPSGVGHVLYGDLTPEGYRKTAQGLALAGGLAMRRLQRKGVISIAYQPDSYRTRYRIINHEIHAP